MTPFALHAAPQAYARRRLDEFCAYLQSKCVYIDVWDATSKLQIGTARVSLAGLLRRGDAGENSDKFFETDSAVVV